MSDRRRSERPPAARLSPDAAGRLEHVTDTAVAESLSQFLGERVGSWKHVRLGKADANLVLNRRG